MTHPDSPTASFKIQDAGQFRLSETHFPPQGGRAKDANVRFTDNLARVKGHIFLFYLFIFAQSSTPMELF